MQRCRSISVACLDQGAILLKKIDKLLLQIEQRSSALKPTGYLMRPVILLGSEGSAGEHGQSCSFGGQSKKISSCRHAGNRELSPDIDMILASVLKFIQDSPTNFRFPWRCFRDCYR
jgi:hypothetical protein